MELVNLQKESPLEYLQHLSYKREASLPCFSLILPRVSPSKCGNCVRIMRSIHIVLQFISSRRKCLLFSSQSFCQKSWEKGLFPFHVVDYYFYAVLYFHLGRFLLLNLGLIYLEMLYPFKNCLWVEKKINMALAQILLLCVFLFVGHFVQLDSGMQQLV